MICRRIAREGPEHRDLAPGEPGLDHEGVVAVALGLSPEQRHDQRLDPLLQSIDLDAAAALSLQRHVMQPDTAALVAAARLDPIGPLVDDGEAEILEKRHALRERARRAAGEDLEAGSRRCLAIAAVEVDAARAIRREALDAGDVGKTIRRIERLAIGGAEGLAIAGVERCGGSGILGGLQNLLQTVGPGSHDLADCSFEFVARDIGRLALVAADDVMGAGKEAIGIGRVGGGKPALIDLGQILAHLAADGRVVAILRDIDQNGNETIELVDPRQRSDARPFRELQDIQREFQQRVFIDLEELVPRIALHHMAEATSRIAVIGEAGALEDARHLVTDIGDRAGGGIIGR